MGDAENIPDHSGESGLLPRSALIGLVAGAAILVLTLLVEPPSGLSPGGWHTLGLALLMAIWWSTEPVPIGVTALLPLILLPLIGQGDVTTAAAAYANPLVFLFLGGFLLAAGINRWGLHRRLAYSVVSAIGTEPRRLVLGFMVACGMLSMAISNTAAVVLMLPVATSVTAALALAHGGDDVNVHRFSRALLLGLAYSASIGGMGTLIGTPPNALLAGYLAESHGIDLSFAAWALVGVPLVLVFLPLAWLVLTRVAFQVSAAFSASMSADDLVSKLADHAPMSPAEKRVAIVFSAAAALWITRPLLNRLPVLANLSDAAIALAAAFVLFLIPNGLAGRHQFLLSWKDARDIPWSVLLLFGGGLSLASAMDRSGLAQWIGTGLASIDGLTPYAFLILLTFTVVMLTELASNTATVAALLPVVATMASAAGIDLIVVAAAVALAASCAFMLPVATPPNAIVFSTGELRVADMMKAGFYMNILSVVLVATAARLFAPVLAALG